MKQTAYILLTLFLFTSGVLFAQPYTVRAYEAYEAKEYVKAKELIDQSIESDEGKDDAQTWALRAFIYKNLENYNENPDTIIRKIIIDSHVKSMELDKNNTLRNKNINGLKSAILRYYNQAVEELLKKQNPDNAIQLYNTYKNTYLEYFEKDFTETDVEFYKALGSHYNDKAKRASLGEDQTNEFYDLAIKAYQKVIEADSLNYNANYNIGTIYYNQGVNILQNMDPELTIEELREKQDKGVELFIKAKPYIHLAHDYTPDRKEPILALWGIYYSLNDFEKADYYRKMLENK